MTRKRLIGKERPTEHFEGVLALKPVGFRERPKLSGFESIVFEDGGMLCLTPSAAGKVCRQIMLRTGSAPVPDTLLTVLRKVKHPIAVRRTRCFTPNAVFWDYKAE